MDIDYKFGNELPRGDGQNVPIQPTINPYVRPVDPSPSMNPSANNVSTGDGYDEFDFGDIPPPPALSGDRDISGPGPDERKPMDGPKLLTAEDAKAALLHLCSANFCYGSKAATEMTIQNMTPTAAYHYCLESFTENRSTAAAEVPFTGGEQTVDTAANGPAPSPWDVQVFAKEKFKDEKKICEVPHTASVQACKKCNGSGQENCTTCQSRGQIPCTSCQGTPGQQCQACGGNGAKVCTACAGKGVKNCGICKGAKMVKKFVQLTVEWVNHVDHFVHQEKLALPEELVRSAQGQIAFKEENPWVYPISQCPQPTINKASLDLLTKHKNQYKNERLLLQRQTVKIVPVTEVQCQWEGKTFTEYVYGTENQAYCADYPQKWCCGYCSIL